MIFNQEDELKGTNKIDGFNIREAAPLFVIILVLWLILLLITGHKIMDHSHFDQHTKQALMWRDGRISFYEDISYLELAFYKNKIYVSFPPTPTFIEWFLTFFFNEKTPNTLILLFFTWVSMIFTYLILLKLTENKWFSYFMSFVFFWGSNILYLSLDGAVWHQGQLYGLFFAISAFLIFLYAGRNYYLVICGFLLGLSAGCRPFYLFLTPFFCYLAYKKFFTISTVFYFIAGLIPSGLFYSIYNYIRFDSIFEFGHKYLPWEKSLNHGVFSFSYLLRNMFYAFIKLPKFDSTKGFVSFHGGGTAVWIVSPVILLGVFYFFKKEIYTFEKILAFVSLLLIWGMLLLHASNGAYQFGYRYSVDLIPLFIILFGKSFKKNNLFIFLVSCYSVVVNTYGAFWFYCIQKIM